MMHSASGTPISLRTMFTPANQRRHLVERMTPAHAFAAHAAIRRQHQPFGWNVLQRQPGQFRHFVGDSTCSVW